MISKTLIESIKIITGLVHTYSAYYLDSCIFCVDQNIVPTICQIINVISLIDPAPTAIDHFNTPVRSIIRNVELFVCAIIRYVWKSNFESITAFSICLLFLVLKTGYSKNNNHRSCKDRPNFSSCNRISEVDSKFNCKIWPDTLQYLRSVFICNILFM